MSERRLPLARSGSQNRKRSVSLSARYTESEAQAIKAMADHAGVSVAALIRSAVLNHPLSRATRRPTINHEAAGNLISGLATLAQAYRKAADAAPDPGKYDALLESACRDLSEMRLVWFQAMGREP